MEFNKTNKDTVFNGYWLYAHGVWNWAVGSCVMPFLQTEEVCRCLKETYNGSVKLMGDSHLRGVSYHIMYASNINNTKEPPYTKIHHSITVGDVEFKWQPQMAGHQKVLSTILQNYDNDVGLFVTDNMAWELHTKGYINFVIGLSKTVNLLHRLAAKNPRMKIVWYEMVTLHDLVGTPDRYEHNYKRNNQLVTALNYHVCSELALSNITCVPAFAMDWPFYKDSVGACDGAHIFCVGKGNKLSGFVGPPVVEALLTNVCN